VNEDERERIREAARELAERTRREQGLPPRVTDERTLELVAALLREPEKDAA
jgi:hypothetical protein